MIALSCLFRITKILTPLLRTWTQWMAGYQQWWEHLSAWCRALTSANPCSSLCISWLHSPHRPISGLCNWLLQSPLLNHFPWSNLEILSFHQVLAMLLHRGFSYRVATGPDLVSSTRTYKCKVRSPKLHTYYATTCLFIILDHSRIKFWSFSFFLNLKTDFCSKS